MRTQEEALNKAIERLNGKAATETEWKLALMISIAESLAIIADQLTKEDQ